MSLVEVIREWLIGVELRDGESLEDGDKRVS